MKKSGTGELTVITEEGDSVEGVDCLLWAIGRTPNTAKLGLDAAGVDMDDKGNIKVVDKYQNTTAKNVYAVGDVTGVWQLTPGEMNDGSSLSLFCSLYSLF